MKINEILLNRYRIIPRFVVESDASFILSLRLDERKSKYLSSTSTDISKQEQWINSYKTRELDNTEYYFIFEGVDGAKYGLSRIYNLDDKSFEIGSWLFSNDSPQGLSILADLFTRDFAFNKLNSQYCRFEVRKENKTVVNYHKKFSPELIFEDDLNYYYKLTRINFDLYKHKLINALWTSWD